MRAPTPHDAQSDEPAPKREKRREERRQERRAKRGGRGRNKQSGCGFPFWLIFMGIIAWNVIGDDIDWDWVRDQVGALAPRLEGEARRLGDGTPSVSPQ